MPDPIRLSLRERAGVHEVRQGQLPLAPGLGVGALRGARLRSAEANEASYCWAFR